MELSVDKDQVKIETSYLYSSHETNFAQPAIKNARHPCHNFRNYRKNVDITLTGLKVHFYHF